MTMRGSMQHLGREVAPLVPKATSGEGVIADGHRAEKKEAPPIRVGDAHLKAQDLLALALVKPVKPSQPSAVTFD
jgi:hypothetical protein